MPGRPQPTNPQTGRPTKLDDSVGPDEDGNPQTAGEAILERLRIGAYREEAAASVGVQKLTLLNWIRTGARARSRVYKGEEVTDPTDIACMRFLNGLEAAEAEAEFTDWRTLGKLAAGGIPQEVITVKVNAAGEEIERTTRTTRTLPDASALQWRLSRRYPHHYTERTELHIKADPAAEVESQDERAAQLADAAEAYLQGREDVAAESVDTPPV